MSNELTPFFYGQHQIRTTLVDGEPWFVAADVCTVLSIGNPSQAVSYLDEDERSSTLITSEGGQQRTANVVNEPGLYSLILRSRKPEAKAFKRWITHEVLPAIRRTGSYSVQPTTAITLPGRRELAQMVIEAEDRAEAAEQRAAALEPAAQAWDVLASANGDWSVREAAYILNRDPAIDTGQNRLFDTLRELKVIGLDDRPYATHSRHVRLRPRTFTNRATGEEFPAKPQVRITAEGLTYLHRRLGGVAPLRLPAQLALIDGSAS